jgi:hypothetical protein
MSNQFSTKNFSIITHFAYRVKNLFSFTSLEDEMSGMLWDEDICLYDEDGWYDTTDPLADLPEDPGAEPHLADFPPGDLVVKPPMVERSEKTAMDALASIVGSKLRQSELITLCDGLFKNYLPKVTRTEKR